MEEGLQADNHFSFVEEKTYQQLDLFAPDLHSFISELI